MTLTNNNIETHSDLTRARPGLPAVMVSPQFSFAPLVKQTIPSVVNIYAKKLVRRQVSPFANDPFFKQFFGNTPFFGAPQERVENSLGSGVIIRENGLVVTNHHVISQSKDITVVLHDRREFPAEIIYSDQKTDIALLRVKTDEGLPALPLANSDNLEVGDMVLAIGNPFGVGQTVTSGIVSALARTTVGITDYQYFIQTDAAINPGNSGGALINLAGQLVGINSAIYTRDGGSNGIGFAIPVNMVSSIVASLDQTGKVVRPWLGLAGQPVTADLAESLGLETPRGVLINQIHPQSSAAKAGIELGDVILSINGKDIEDPQALRFRLATLQVGENAMLTIQRGQTERSVLVRLEAAVEDPLRDIRLLSGAHILNGVTVANLSPALAEEIGLDGFATGVVIMDLDRLSPARRLNLRKGDIVKAINDTAIADVKSLERFLQKQSKGWKLLINRQGQEVVIQIR